MKCIKLVWFDVRNGMLRTPLLFVVPFAVAVAACFDFSQRIFLLNYDKDPDDYVNGSFADFMVYIYGGMDKYVPSRDELFRFPVRWALVIFLLLFLTLTYPYKDMQGVGQQILVRAKSRKAWWISKCVWNILSVSVYHLIIAVTVLLFCLFNGNNIVGEVNKKLQYELFYCDLSSVAPDSARWDSVMIFLPIFVSVGISLMQMLISLFIKPVFSFFVSVFLMVSSAYFTSPYLIGNYAMSMRYDIVIDGGVSIKDGVVISFLFIFVSVFGGVLCFNRYDIINRD